LAGNGLSDRRTTEQSLNRSTTASGVSLEDLSDESARFIDLGDGISRSRAGRRSRIRLAHLSAQVPQVANDVPACFRRGGRHRYLSAMCIDHKKFALFLHRALRQLMNPLLFILWKVPNASQFDPQLTERHIGSPLEDVGNLCSRLSDALHPLSESLSLATRVVKGLSKPLHLSGDPSYLARLTSQTARHRPHDTPESVHAERDLVDQTQEIGHLLACLIEPLGFDASRDADRSTATSTRLRDDIVTAGLSAEGLSAERRVRRRHYDIPL
jgi:hypothetical protein